MKLTNMDLDGFTVTEINNVLHTNEQDVTAEYCSSILKQCKSLEGYALYLAKEVVFKNDRHGYLNFLDENSITVKVANGRIKYFKAKELFSDPLLLPNNITAFKHLNGNGNAEKVKAYKRVRLLLNEDYPSTTDVGFVSALLRRGILDEDLLIQFVNTMKKQPATVKIAFTSKSKSVGINTILNAIKNGYTEGQLISLIREGSNTTPKQEEVVTSRFEWDKYSDDDKYNRVMFLERKLKELTNGKIEE